MKAVIVIFPGSNCDRDIMVALAGCGAQVSSIWHKEKTLPKADLVVLPGGFSFGDYLRCGAMAAHSPIMREIKSHSDKGGYVLGICNGFQILTEAAILPGILLRNQGLRFICRDIYLKPDNTDTSFTRRYKGMKSIKIPVAHHDGNYFADTDTLKSIEDNGQVAFRYSNENGEVNPEANPNGAQKNIAGIFNKQKNVLGLMPHPERMWHPSLGGTDGRILLDSLIAG